MILDKQTELSNAQAITASAVSTNQLDLGPSSYAGNSWGGHPPILPLIFTIDTDFTAAGAATLQIQLRSSASPDMSSPRLHALTPPIPVASLKKGVKLDDLGASLSVPSGALRYLDASYIVATGPFTAGNISCRAASDRATNYGS